MVTVYDVPPDALIPRLAQQLKSEGKIKPPEWADFVKTGVHKEKAPVQDDWWYLRVAAVLRKVYIKGPIGIERLSSDFGGSVDRGSRPYKAKKGSRSIIRTVLKQLEEIGYVVSEKGQGRRIAPQGRSLVDHVSYEVFKELAKDDVELAKY
ncbi:MAG: 30S ribosomal protein S19e [Fidelibacterota bacterium]|nr:MAG: 30S ribosomal protein S19e [Candidatus Neomarinimicrobiota bacterium]